MIGLFIDYKRDIRMSLNLAFIISGNRSTTLDENIGKFAEHLKREGYKLNYNNVSDFRLLEVYDDFTREVILRFTATFMDKSSIFVSLYSKDHEILCYSADGYLPMVGPFTQPEIGLLRDLKLIENRVVYNGFESTQFNFEFKGEGTFDFLKYFLCENDYIKVICGTATIEISKKILSAVIEDHGLQNFNDVVDNLVYRHVSYANFIKAIDVEFPGYYEAIAGLFNGLTHFTKYNPGQNRVFAALNYIKQNSVLMQVYDFEQLVNAQKWTINF